MCRFKFIKLKNNEIWGIQQQKMRMFLPELQEIHDNGEQQMARPFFNRRKYVLGKYTYATIVYLVYRDKWPSFGNNKLFTV